MEIEINGFLIENIDHNVIELDGPLLTCRLAYSKNSYQCPQER